MNRDDLTLIGTILGLTAGITTLAAVTLTALQTRRALRDLEAIRSNKPQEPHVHILESIATAGAVVAIVGAFAALFAALGVTLGRPTRYVVRDYPAAPPAPPPPAEPAAFGAITVKHEGNGWRLAFVGALAAAILLGTTLVGHVREDRRATLSAESILAGLELSVYRLEHRAAVTEASLRNEAERCAVERAQLVRLFHCGRPEGCLFLVDDVAGNVPFAPRSDVSTALGRTVTPFAP